MLNGTITYYLPYNILSSSNLVVNVCIVEYKFNPGQIQCGVKDLPGIKPIFHNTYIHN